MSITSAANVPLITAASAGLEGGVGTSASTISLAATGTADSGPIQAWPMIVADGFAVEAGQSSASLPFIIAAGTTAILADSAAIVPRILIAAQGYSGVVATSSLSLPLLRAAGMGYGPADGQSITINIPLILAVGTGYESVGATYNTIVMHTESQALTTYTNYPFNSFARFNGVYLAAGAGGIFALAGATDDGTFIDAAARVGITDFGTSHLKKADRMYVGYRTDGEMVLRVFTDEINVRDYLLRPTGKLGLHGNHVRIGKGVEARYWQFEIRNRNGSDFELNMMEVKPTVLRRRIGGGDA